MTATVAELELKILDLQDAVNTTWLILTGACVFFMQAGFALVEAGSMRSKNIISILLKNFIDAAIGAIVYYLWGYAFCFGKSTDPNNFIGNTKFAIKELNHGEPKEYALWFFQFTFCATAATIVSGACAERVKFGVYTVFSVAMTGWIYPIIVHSVWSKEGWLSPFNDGAQVSKVGPPNRGVYDFAGSGVVHLAGGTASLVGSYILGPRLGRFDDKGNPAPGFNGHSAHLTTLGTFILFFSWYSFNCGSTMRMTDGGFAIAARAAMTTTLSGMTASITALTIGYVRSGCTHFTLSHCLNGCLGGLVAITAGCALVTPWAAVTVGILSGTLTYCGSLFTLKVLRVDDPVDAFTVHGMNGTLGVLVPGFFATEAQIMAVYGIDEAKYAGVLMGGSGVQLAYQLLFVAWVVGWTAGWTAIVFLCLRLTLGLRVPEALEQCGLDTAEYGGQGYDVTLTVFELQRIRDQIAALQRTCGMPVESDDSTILTAVMTTTNSSTAAVQRLNPLTVVADDSRIAS